MVPAGLEIVDGSISNDGVLGEDGTIRWNVEQVAGANEYGEPGTCCNWILRNQTKKRRKLIT